MKSANLYLIPVLLGGENISELIPPATLEIIKTLKYFIVEDERSARRFLKLAGTSIAQSELQLQELDKHDIHLNYREMLKPAAEGNDMGLLSEAGAPSVADPGAAIVKAAHQMKIRVIPLTGPSSILLALMASGLNGQSFCFHGYLPIEKAVRIRKIKLIEKDASQRNQTQIFIETPYRNNQLLKDLVEQLAPSVNLCIAANITLPEEYILTQQISEWRKKIPDLNKLPAVFLIL